MGGAKTRKRFRENETSSWFISVPPPLGASGLTFYTLNVSAGSGINLNFIADVDE